MSSDPALQRYSRQTRFPAIGEAGQRRLLASRAVVCGCGALGTVIANGLARAGVGFLRIIDRDFPEESNLQRQLLYDEQDVRERLPKAEAAARKLRQVNSTIRIDAAITDLDYANIDALCGDADVILDGTDNFETRFLINDFACKTGRPWVYGACIASEGRVMTILPGRTACLRCLMPTIPPVGTGGTCETAGILGSASTMVGALQVVEAIKILVGALEQVQSGLTVFDVWDGSYRTLRTDNLRERADCPACKHGHYQWLSGSARSLSTSLCGRNAVQVAPAARAPMDWNALRDRLGSLSEVVVNPYLARFNIDGFEFSVFNDGRAIIKGTDDPAIARSLYARYIGG